MSFHVSEPHVGHQESTQKQESVDGQDTVHDEYRAPLFDILREKTIILSPVSGEMVLRYAVS